MNLAASSILVTGATGSLGSQLLYELTRRGIRPVAMVRQQSNTAYIDSLGLEKRMADLRSAEELGRAAQGIDLIIHTAAIVNFRGDRLTQFTGINTFGAVLLYQAAKAAGVRRFVQVSSVATIGGLPRTDAMRAAPTMVMTEDYDFNLGHLRIPYILSKRAAEDQLRELAGASGPELVIVNPSIIVAPSRHGRDRSRVEQAARRRWAPSLSNRVNLVDIRDVVPGILAAAEQGRPGERYILAGEHPTARELVSMIFAHAGRKPFFFPVPRWLTNAVARFALLWYRFSGKGKLSAYPDLARLLDYDWAFSSSKAERELGYKSRPLAKTLRDLVTENFHGTYLRP